MEKSYWWQREEYLNFLSLEFTGKTYQGNLEDLNTDRIIDCTKKMGFKVLVVFGIGHGTKAYFQSKFVPHHEMLGNRDIIKELIEKCRNNDIYFMTYNDLLCASYRILNSHPEWRRVDRMGRLLKEHFGYGVCPNTSVFDCFLAGIREQVEMGVNGIFVDSAGSSIGCFCRKCRDSCKTMLGKEIESASEQDLNILRREQYIERLRKIGETIKKTNKNCMFLMNGIPGGMEKIVGCLDAVGSEAFFGVNYGRLSILWAPAYAAKSVRACTNRKQRNVVYSRYMQGPLAHIPTTVEELKYAMIETVAHDASVWFSTYDLGFFNYTETYDEIGATNRLLSHNKNYLYGQTPKTKIALAFSPDEITHTVTHHPNLVGYFESLMRERISFDFINLKLLKKNSLAKYDLLILPGVEVIGSKESYFIKKFLNNGGKLIATYNTALLDENFKKRKTYPLPFGAKPISKKKFSDSKGYSAGEYIIPENHHSLLGELRDKEVISGFSEAVKTIPDKNSTVIAYMAQRELGRGPYTPIKGKSRYPAIILNNQKNVILIPINIDEAYIRYRQECMSYIMNRAVRYFLGEEIGIKTNAPLSVDINIKRQDEKKRTIIFLVNTTGSPVRPLRENVPVRDIEISLDCPRPQKVFSLRGKEVKFGYRKNILTVKLTELLDWDVIVSK